MRLDDLPDEAIAEIAARMSPAARRWLTLVNVIGLARMGEPVDRGQLAHVLGLLDDAGEPDPDQLNALEHEFVQVTSDMQVCITPRAEPQMLRLLSRREQS